MRSIRVLFLLSVLATSAALAAPQTYKLHGDHTQVVFVINHLGFSNTHGSFTKISGRLVFDEQKPESSKVTVVIKAASLDTGLKTRDVELVGPMFLDAKKYPEIRFVSTKVVKTDGNTYLFHHR